MLVSKLPAFENKKYTSYYHFHGNGPYGKIPTKKEPIRTPGFTPRLPCRIIKCGIAVSKSQLVFRIQHIPWTDIPNEEATLQLGGITFLSTCNCGSSDLNIKELPLFL